MQGTIFILDFRSLIFVDYLGGGGRVTGGSLLSKTALLVCIPAGQFSKRAGHFFARLVIYFSLSGRRGEWFQAAPYTWRRCFCNAY